MSALVVLTTVPNRRIGRKIARDLVAKHLAACVSVGGGWDSTYRWKKKIESSTEVVLFIKTSRKRFSGLRKRLSACHPYELPEIIALPVTDASKEYLRWIEDSVK